MGDMASETAVLADDGGGWIATPWDYSSMRLLRLSADGSGELNYWYGQTCYARINCRWEVECPARLRLSYLPSSAYQAFRGYIPAEDKPHRVLDFLLTSGEVSGIESITAALYRFLWTRELSEPPWPPELPLPYKVPHVFYGHPDRVKDFRIVVHSDGTFTATCKACGVTIKTAEKNGLVWYVCPGCKRSSFQPVGNVKRDIVLAEQRAGAYECELFFLSQLPDGLAPPDECRA